MSELKAQLKTMNQELSDNQDIMTELNKELGEAEERETKTKKKSKEISRCVNKSR